MTDSLSALSRAEMTEQMNIPHASPSDVLAYESVLTLFRRLSKPLLLFDRHRHNAATKMHSMFSLQNITMSKPFLKYAAGRSL